MIIFYSHRDGNPILEKIQYLKNLIVHMITQCTENPSNGIGQWSDARKGLQKQATLSLIIAN